MLMHYFQFRLSYKAEIELVPIYLACSDLPLKFRLAPLDGIYTKNILIIIIYLCTNLSFNNRIPRYRVYLKTPMME